MGGKAPSIQNVDRLDPAQRQAMQQILGSDLQQLFDPELQQQFFQAQVSEPALQQFKEEIIPAINEQFIGQGAASSSGLNRAITKAGSDLQSQLAAQLSGFQQQGQANQLQLILAALGMQPYVQQVNPGKPGFGGIVGSALGAGIGGVFGGPAGAKIGSGVGGSIGGVF